MKNNDFLSIADLSKQDLLGLLKLAQKLKKSPYGSVLTNRHVGLIFQKPSTRTSVSFAVGIQQLGGKALILNADILQIKRGETPKDTGRVLSRYLDAIVIRANSHAEVQEMARYATIPVINGLTDWEHPCQVLADLLTIMEKKRLKDPRDLAKIKVSYFGDGNNVANSWILAASLLGMEFHLGCPKAYGPKKEVLDLARKLSRTGRDRIKVFAKPADAAKGAHVLYTDVWASMGQESEARKRKKALSPFQLNRSLVKKARPRALVMHCLPAHRGEEITNEVMEGPNSVIFDQAENRLHMQKAVLATVIKGKK